MRKRFYIKAIRLILVLVALFSSCSKADKILDSRDFDTRYPSSIFTGIAGLKAHESSVGVIGVFERSDFKFPESLVFVPISDRGNYDRYEEFLGRSFRGEFQGGRTASFKEGDYGYKIYINAQNDRVLFSMTFIR